jgi:hypothetical protein
MKLKYNGGWVCTDEDENQWGRQISEKVFEFKQDIVWSDDSVEKVSATIDLDEYTEQEKNSVACSYYGSMEGLIDMCGEDSDWILAEALFETGIFD